MEKSNTEALIPQEKTPAPSLERQVYNFGGSGVEVNVAQFNPRPSLLTNEGQETVNPNKKAVVYLMGWPWTAKDEATWAFPAQLAQNLDTTCYSIDTAKAGGDKKALALQGKAIGQFLIDKGVEEVTLVGHSLGAIKAAYTVYELQQSSRVRINALVLADPMGLDKRWTLGLAIDLARDVGIVAPKMRKRGGVKAGEAGPAIEAVTSAQFVKEFRADLKMISKTGKLGIPLLWSQRKALKSRDPIFSKLGNVPVWVIAGGKDRVSNYKRYLPEKEVQEGMQPVKSGDELRDWVISSNKWEHLPKKEQAKFASKDEFIERYIKDYRKQEEMFRLARARSALAKEKYFGPTAPVKVSVTERQADHGGIPAVRGKQTSHIISRILDSLKR